MSEAPVVRICAGADCQKKGKAHARLIELLEARARVQPVRCQKVCEGPVVGLEIDGALEWFDKVKGKAARAALVRLLDEGELGEPLKTRRVKKRSGCLR